MAEIKENNVIDINKNKIELKQLESTLSAIAMEIQNFSSYEDKEFVSAQNTMTEPRANIEKMNSHKSLKAKYLQINKLTADLKLVCEIARKAFIAKENEIRILTRQLNDVNKTTAENGKINQKNSEGINNQIIHNQEEKLNKLINLGYTELQKIQRNPKKEHIPLLQLKEIIYSCGQFYADFSNEKIIQKQKAQKLEDENRFLNSEIFFLRKRLYAMRKEVINLRQQNQRLNKEVGVTIKNTTNQSDSSNSFTKNDDVENDFIKASSNSMRTKLSLESKSFLDFTSHFSLVKNLLSKQSTMLKGLKEISEEFKKCESFH